MCVYIYIYLYIYDEAEQERGLVYLYDAALQLSWDGIRHVPLLLGLPRPGASSAAKSPRSLPPQKKSSKMRWRT